MSHAVPARMSLAAFDAQMTASGWCTFEAVVEEPLVAELIADLEQSYEVRRRIQIRNGVDANTEGTAHHLLADGNSFIELLSRAYLDDYITAFFGGNYILNAFGGNLNLKGRASYASNVHRDVRTYTTEMRLLLNSIIMLDDFTLENGATYLLAGSHLSKGKPSDAEFFATADRAVGKRGSLVVWDSKIWHAAGANTTDLPRRALSLLYSQPFMKQQFDYPRSVGYANADKFSETFRQIIGFNARVPASLDEWYQVPAKRFYKRDQG